MNVLPRRKAVYRRPPFVQRRALSIAANNNGSLVRIGAVYRASYLSGAEKIRVETVQALVAHGFMAYAGENLVRLTVSGEAMAQDFFRAEAEAAAAVKQHRAKRAARSASPKQPPAVFPAMDTAPNPIARRLPYADN